MLLFDEGNVLSWATFMPLLGAAAIIVLVAVRSLGKLPKRVADDGARWIALVASGGSLLAAIAAWQLYDPSKAGAQLEHHFVWIRAFNIEYYLGTDGLSISMILLSGLVSFIATIASMPWWSGKRAAEMAGMVEHEEGHGGHGGGGADAHPRHFSVRMVPGYFVMLLLLQTGMMGTFAALDMFLFYVFWEVMLLPMYFLIGVWGGPRKEYAAIKFFLYTLAGSVLMLLAIIGIYYASLPAVLADGTLSSGHTFNLVALAQQGAQGVFDRAPALALFGGKLVVGFAPVVFVFLFIGFAIKIPMVPFHTWLPDAHVEAPTPVSVILAGVLLKMGIYGILRFNYPLLPGATAWAANAMAVFGMINIVYGAFVCLGQRDLKKLIAYSSVSHMGFSLLGMASMTPAGISGAVLNLFTHGIISPMLFLIVGVIYDRAHHREIEKFGGLGVVMPEYTAVMGLAFFASLGLPGLAGFISEFMVFSGAFPVFTTYTIISATSVIITAAYYLWAIHRMFLGKLNPVYADYPDLNWRERISLYPLAALAIVLGFYPQAILSVVNNTLHALVRGIHPL